MSQTIFTQADFKAAAASISRRLRDTHPEGEYDCDGCWYPSDNEECSCCAHAYPPSAARPLPLLKHCRTAEHCANLFGANFVSVRQILSRFDNGNTEAEILAEQEEYLADQAKKAAKAAAKQERERAKEAKNMRKFARKFLKVVCAA